MLKNSLPKTEQKPADGRPEGLLTRKARTKIDSPCECEQLKLEISNSKEALRDFEREDKVIQPSENEVTASKLVASNVKVVDGRYQIPVPLKPDIVDKLPNYYESAVKRTVALRKKTLKNADLKCSL